MDMSLFQRTDQLFLFLFLGHHDHHYSALIGCPVVMMEALLIREYAIN
jgi:hypothetical protein